MGTDIRHRVAGTAIAVTLAVGTAGCGGSAATGSTPAGTATTTTTTAAPTVAARQAAGTAEATATASPVLADGRSAAYLTGLNGSKNTVTLDLIEFLTGDAAKAEWKKEHPENPDGPDNDYLIVNKNKKLRTLPVTAGAKCVVLSTLGSTDTKTISFAELPAYLKKQSKGITVTPPSINPLPFWLTVKNGAVTRFEQQFLP
jgi:hypothetical protein